MIFFHMLRPAWLVVCLTMWFGHALVFGNESSEPLREENHFARARFFYDEGVVFEAIKELDLHLASEPQDISALMFLGQLLMQVGHEERAATVLSDVLYLDPDNAEADRLLIRMRNMLGQRVDHQNLESVLQFARVSARPGSYDRAAAYYRRALALEDSTALHLEFARMLSWAEYYGESAYHYSIVLQRNPKALPVMREAGRVFNALGDFDRAIEVLEVYLESRPLDTVALLDVARALVWSGRTKEGALRLRSVIEQEPDRTDVLLVRASLAEIEDRLLDAYRLYRDVLDKEPGNGEALARIADLERDDRIEVARLRSAIAEDSKNMELHLALAALLAKHERYGEAIRLLEDANRYAPENEAVYERLRILREQDLARVERRLRSFRVSQAQRLDAKIMQLRDWLASNPEDVRTRVSLAQMFYDAGLLDEALVELQEAQRSAPMDPLVFEMMNLIVTQQQQQSLEEGIQEGRLLQ